MSTLTKHTCSPIFFRSAMTCVHAGVRGTSSAHPSHIDYNSYLECISARKWPQCREIWGRIKCVSDSFKMRRSRPLRHFESKPRLVHCRTAGGRSVWKKKSLLWDMDEDDEWNQAEKEHVSGAGLLRGWRVRLHLDYINSTGGRFHPKGLTSPFQSIPIQSKHLQRNKCWTVFCSYSFGEITNQIDTIFHFLDKKV